MSGEGARGVLVLGMHRSGTSVVTGLVRALGPSTSTDAIGPTAWNPRGLWESRSLIAVNDRLLAEIGYSWWYPPPDEPLYSNVTLGLGRFETAARVAFDRVHPAASWVWKDPRTSLLLPFWNRIVGGVGILVLRHPLDVARSLERRNAMPIPLALALWERYNRLILRHATGMPLLVLPYDDLLDDGERSVARLRGFLRQFPLVELERPAGAGADGLVDRSLRHSQVRTSDQPSDPAFASAFELHARLTAWFDAPEALSATALPQEESWVSEALEEWGPQRPPMWREPSG